MTDIAGTVHPAAKKVPMDWKKIFFLFLGIFLFLVVHFSPMWPDAVDPMGEHFVLTDRKSVV